MTNPLAIGPRLHTSPRPALLMAALCLTLLLTGCASSSKVATVRATSEQRVSDAHQPSGVSAQLTPPTAGPGLKPMMVPGTGNFTRSSRVPRGGEIASGSPGNSPTTANPTPLGAIPTPVPTPAGALAPDKSSADQFQLSFIDTEIGVVVASVLGDGLGLTYAIDPSIKGTMTLQASRNLTREEVLPALENALRLYGIAMVEVNGSYNIMPIADARRHVLSLREPGDTAPGFGIQVVPLQYVSASDIEKTLRSVASDGAVVRVDEGRNLLIVAGTSQERAAILELVRTFDVDWLAGMSFAIFPFEYTDAKTAADELGHVFAEEKSPIASVVRFIPLTRLNALLVVSYQPRYLQEIETWIHRLDVGTSGPGRRIYVYDVQNGKADDLAKSLAQVLSLNYSPTETSGAGGASLSVNGTTGNLSQSTSANPGSGLASGSEGFGSNTGLGSGGGLGSGAGMGGGSGPGTGFGSGSGYGGSEIDRFGGPRSGGTLRASGMGAGNNGMSIAPSVESNSLMILATPSEFSMVEAALKRLDVPPLEVMIEATLAEVTLTDQLRFGLQWSYLTKQGPVAFSETSSGAIGQQFPGLSFLYTGRSDISAVLSSLETVTTVKVLSSPKLLVLNNREAELKIGDQVPVITQSAVGTLTSNSAIVNSVQMMDTGVLLQIVPRVNKNGLVTLDISQQVSDVGATTTSSINSPTIHQREMSSTVEVRDGETIALGGLIRESASKGRDGLPFLSKIPILGALFGSTSNEKDRTELVVLLKPHVIRSSDDSADLMEDLRSQFKTLKRQFSQLAPPQAKLKKQ